ncbi:hypothetical protein EJ06DRAFT_560035 [Trichodelitschia bisporula]|uniref:Uncharacterized protein n=1 Tax=Trichodelitschia bisporula TaxID=703511 RepID=A0A6G1HKQ4_9PEZI|nr:hypothetical protein EJ06DRAFT_560035 [Trichodelitschia bisporula]
MLNAPHATGGITAIEKTADKKDKKKTSSEDGKAPLSEKKKEKKKTNSEDVNEKRDFPKSWNREKA